MHRAFECRGRDDAFNREAEVFKADIASAIAYVTDWPHKPMREFFKRNIREYTNAIDDSSVGPLYGLVVF